MGGEKETAARSIGRYVLFREVAHGGMATVHLGRLRGPAGFSRTVAIKRLHPQFARNPEFVSMFLDEARLAARVQHPNVVDVLDVVAAGELFLVMDYVHGESLAKLLAASREAGIPVLPRIVTAIGINVLDGLHAAHEARNERGDPLGFRASRRQPAERHGGCRRRRPRPRLRHREGQRARPRDHGRGADQARRREHGARAAGRRVDRLAHRRLRRVGAALGGADGPALHAGRGRRPGRAAHSHARARGPERPQPGGPGSARRGGRPGARARPGRPVAHGARHGRRAR